jgi:hypothetical protein
VIVAVVSREPIIIDFYDGFVTGLIVTTETCYFGYLLAFDPDRRIRRFVLLPLENSEFEAFENAVRANDAAQERLLTAALVDRMDRAQWTNVSPTIGQVLPVYAFGPQETNRLPPPRASTIDAAVSDKAKRWLNFPQTE